MMGRRAQAMVEQRTEAAWSLLRREEPGVQIAQRYGIPEATRYRLRD